MQMAAFLCYTITKTDEFVSSRYIGAGRAVRSGQLARSKSAERCGSPAATSKGHWPFEAPTEPTGETSSLQGSRVKPLPSDMMLCVISYWVLSGAKWRQIQQLRCCVFPRQAKEMFIVTIDGIFLLFKNILKQPCIKSACVI